MQINSPSPNGKQSVHRIALVMPTMLAVRSVLESPIAKLLANQSNLKVDLLTNAAKDADRISVFKNMSWHHLRRPVGLLHPGNFHLGNLIRKILHRISFGLFSGKFGFGNLVYRFNHKHQFAGHLQKIHLPPQRKKREAVAGNYVDKKYGFPATESQTFFNWLYRTYYSLWDSKARTETFLRTNKPDLIVLYYIQSPQIKPYVIAAKKLGIPTLGVIGSWDKLTTKGPLPPHIDRYIVGSQKMSEELQQYHDIPLDKISITGWPQMDVYESPDLMQDRASLFEAIGIPQDHKLLLFGANSKRLGPHEPDISRHLSQQVAQGIFGACTLLIRPHPKDHTALERYSQFHSPPYVIVQPPEEGRLDYLASLLSHADVVIASQGSISLDAIALGSCVVNIAFDGNLKPEHYASIKRWYELDHYLPVVECGGVQLVENYHALDQAIVTYLENPETHQAGRDCVHRTQLEPFDGKASQRLVDLMLEHMDANMVRKKKQSTQ